ncbi:unnamed protein product [Toxocara canis]|uniref:Prominin-1 n=1 Tax=Toxocara canis TaxID=6265 RepID=A0A183UZS1_TOXCA|nr:unnamed protein product [Toxocara canis]
MRGDVMALSLNCHLFSILPLFVVVNGLSRVENDCVGVVPTVSSFSESYGGIDNFYNLAEGVASRLQPNFDEEIVETAAIAVLIVCAAFIIGLPIAGICFCSYRICGKCGANREQTGSSKCMLCMYLSLLIGTLTIIVLAVFLYALSVQHATNAIETIDQPADTVIKDAQQMVTFMTDDLSCNTNATISNLFTQIQDALIALPVDVIKRFKQQYGYYNANAIIISSDEVKRSLNGTVVSIDEAERMLKALMNVLPAESDTLQQLRICLSNYYSALRQLSIAINNADQKIQDSKTTIERTLVEVTRKMSEASAKIDEFIGGMKAAVDVVLRNGTSDMVERLKEVHANLNESPVKAILIKTLYVAVAVPCLVIVLPAVLVTICATSRLFIRCEFISETDKAKEDIPSERSSCSSFFGHLATFAISMAFIFGWIVMLVASIGFIGGYSIETVCHPLFHDHTMQLLKNVPALSINVTNPLNRQQVALNIGEALDECRQENTIFAALKGDQLMNLDATSIEENLDAARIQAIDAFANFDLTPSWPTDTLTHINKALDNIQESVQRLDTSLTSHSSLNENSTVEAENRLKLVKRSLLNATGLLSPQVRRLKIIGELWAKSSTSHRKQAESIINEQFERITANITAYIQHAKDSLLSETLNCRPVYDTWQNVGSVFCGYLGRPAQGIWSSAAVTALCFIPLIILLMLISKYLFRMKPNYDRGMYLYPTISTLHGGSICAYDSSSGTSDVPLVRSGCDLAPSRILPRFPAHQRQHSNAFYGYGNSAYNHDADSERPHLYNARLMNRFPESRNSHLYASTVNDHPSSERFHAQRADNRWWQR